MSEIAQRILFHMADHPAQAYSADELTAALLNYCTRDAVDQALEALQADALIRPLGTDDLAGAGYDNVARYVLTSTGLAAAGGPDG